MRDALKRDRPDVVGVVGYARPECMAALSWATRRARPVVLLSESQRIDKPRVWWKERVKSRRVRRCASALVGGPRHRSYLAELGMPEERIVLGYDAVDNQGLEAQAQAARTAGRSWIPVAGRYLLAVNRFVPEKNLAMLIRAFGRVIEAMPAEQAWSLVLCGDGPERRALEALVERLGLAGRVHFPGFLQEAELVPYYAFASAFVHASLSEPWGLVVNEAAACGLPLVVSDRAGCVETLVPDPIGTTGRRFDPGDLEGVVAAMSWVTSLSDAKRAEIGMRARDVARQWGPERFAEGMLEALAIAIRGQGPHFRGRENNHMVAP
jgi:glycosyltransferase involved in cell wall biosynthesis